MRRWAIVSSLLSAAAFAQEPSAAVWLQPVGLTLAPVGVAVAGAGTYVAVPLGATIELDSWALNLEATVYTFRSRVVTQTGPASAFTGGYLCLGPLFHTGSVPLNGWFISPKLMVGVFHEFVRNLNSIEILPAVDAGWQHTWGHVYFAIMLGLSVGYSLQNADMVEGPAINPQGPTSPQTVVGLNLNVLRLGFAF